MGCALVDLATNRVINIIVADPSYTAPPGQQAVFYPDGNWADWVWTKDGGFALDPVPVPEPVVEPEPEIKPADAAPVEPEPVAPAPVDPPLDASAEPAPVDAPIPVVDQTPIDPAITESSSSTGG